MASPLTLRRTRLTDASGRPAQDDYTVHDGGPAPIGRIYKSVGYRNGDWFWATMRFPSSGSQSGWAGSLDEAKAAFRSAWGREGAPARRATG